MEVLYLFIQLVLDNPISSALLVTLAVLFGHILNRVHVTATVLIDDEVFGVGDTVWLAVESEDDSSEWHSARKVVLTGIYPDGTVRIRIPIGDGQSSRVLDHICPSRLSSRPFGLQVVSSGDHAA